MVDSQTVVPTAEHTWCTESSMLETCGHARSWCSTCSTCSTARGAMRSEFDQPVVACGPDALPAAGCLQTGRGCHRPPTSHLHARVPLQQGAQASQHQAAAAACAQHAC